MTCPTHGSEFKAADGSVVRGPAARPLLPVAVKVTGQDVTLA
jgi:Rieske Fe-S protein